MPLNPAARTRHPPPTRPSVPGAARPRSCETCR